ncbi:MAG: molybdenum cofactor guanylyltransferase [Clostridia bacterium]|nr:molybdenum cofactor guanylyltransferase [Clostridia bacterium]
MGQPKALLRLGGNTIIERVVGVAAGVCREVLLVSNEPGAYARLGLPVVTDRFLGRGPLAGIHAGLLAATWDRSLVLACDLPFLEAPLLRGLLEASCGFDVAVPVVRGYPEPLVGVYSRDCLPAVEEVLSLSERPKVTDFFSRVRVCYVPEAEVAKWTDVRKAFFNINTPADLARAGLWA